MSLVQMIKKANKNEQYKQLNMKENETKNMMVCCST